MIEIYADGAGLAEIAELAHDPRISGFTTNPSLARKAGVTDYATFAREALKAAAGKPVSIEVLADDVAGMVRQAEDICAISRYAVVKIPVMNTAGEDTGEVIRYLARQKIALNVTAIMTRDQIRSVMRSLDGAEAIVSIFAGRIRDFGYDALPTMRYAVRHRGAAKVLWASTREIWNVYEAEQAGCDIITVPHEMLPKLRMRGKDLTELSLETVRQFHQDGKGYSL